MENDQHKDSGHGNALQTAVQNTTVMMENHQHEDSSRGDALEANSASNSSDLGNDTSSKDAASTSPTPIASSRPEVKTAPLETYILSAEAKLAFRLPTRTTPVFPSFPGSTPPTLHSDRENKIVLYCGAFNPPHAGHAALLSHTYFSTDSSTIAVLILPTRTVSGKLNLSNADGRHFRLTYSQRSSLWQDNLLSRFSWVFPGGGYENMLWYIDFIRWAAKEHGFKISFSSLSGADHAYSLGSPWDSSILIRITSDITRAVFFAKPAKPDPVKEPQIRRLADCEPWEDLPQEELQWEGGEEEEKPKCWPCWPCYKMRKVYPEAFDDKGRSTVSDHFVNLATAPDILLARCHAAPKLLKWCQCIDPEVRLERLAHKQELAAHLVFIPSTQDPNSPTFFGPMSATSIRQEFLEADILAPEFRRQMSEKVLNVNWLCTFLGWEMAEENVKRPRESSCTGYDDSATERLKKESDGAADDSTAKRLKKESKDDVDVDSVRERSKKSMLDLAKEPGMDDE
ncbi:hypothetical protein CFE70_004513 [Pyrenophora teres f. teres 0-1]|uniref:Cytidyltransferase-like domain-containing protein n=2 Tax=Pyrenophora teres f. teres TaxID=97479 RepID=E3RXE9_PYRTT|nr:hypothetical protein PTT_14061 [Pyrenophora teres f. teres 0-1]KAE8833462.1 hypothetical protein HRS9139_05281 [Pyrenophora teres f. teres]KAE8840769.1 hypothetical protein PTNB85_04168 [Pyrenophora teres f. teres]KAE8849092.1 hypothetical protein HRS9122_03108 [Pyrenophora teres f. teres]KAE8864265.1 hypothetical protein PTNB29_04229 [Pyrenophora teres f. teres]